MNELALFAGIGGGILGGSIVGFRTVCAVESDAHSAAVLVARQNDGSLPPFPIWDDVRTFNGIRWRGVVDLVSGGFPCQDVSKSGTHSGLDGERSGLWREFARIVHDVRPRWVFVENSPALVVRGLGRVLGDLAALGFDAAWCVLGADAVGAPHQRNRLWLLAKAVADTDGERLPTPQTESLALEEFVGAGVGGGGAGTGGGAIWWGIEPRIRRVVDGYAARLDRSAGQPFARQLAGVENGVRNRVSRIRGLGNAQVPICATIAFLALKKLLETHSQ